MTDGVFSIQVHHQHILRQRRNTESHSPSSPSPYGSSLVSANERHSREIWKTEEKERLNRGENDPGSYICASKKIFIKILHVADILKIQPLVSQNSSFLSEWRDQNKKTKTHKNKTTSELTRKYEDMFQTIINSIMKTEQKYNRQEILEKEVDILEFLFRSILKF